MLAALLGALAFPLAGCTALTTAQGLAPFVSTRTAGALHPFERPRIDDQKLEEIAAHQGPPAAERVRSWRNLLESAAALEEPAKLEVVSRFFNAAIGYIPDGSAGGESDRWASPLETLLRGAGDCEDYAIAKYFSLRWLGVEADRLRITYVLAGEPGTAHMVLVYRRSGETPALVLDNLTGSIEELSARTDLRPDFSFNESNVWRESGAKRGQRIGGPGALATWTRLAEQMGQDGI